MRLIGSLVGILALVLVQPSVVIAAQPGELAVIYSSFNEGGQDLYDHGQAAPIFFKKANRRESWAMSFQTPRRATTAKIELALTHESGTNQLEVSLHRNGHLDVPAKVIKTVEVSNLPPWGTCCEVVTAELNDVALKPNQLYWVVVRAHHGTVGYWNLNTLGLRGLAAVSYGDKHWVQQSNDIVSAYRVLGTYD